MIISQVSYRTNGPLVTMRDMSHENLDSGSLTMTLNTGRGPIKEKSIL